MKDIIIKIIPHKARSRHIVNGSAGSSISSISGTIRQETDLTIVKENDSTEGTDSNVFSSKRTIKEITDRGHSHNNFSLLNLLTIVSGYLHYNGTKINAGHADTSTTADDLAANGTGAGKYARKDISQTIAEVFTFTKGIIAGALSYFDYGIHVVGGVVADTIEAVTSIKIGNATVTNPSGIVTVDKPINVAGDITSTTGDVKGEDIRATDAVKIGPNAEAKAEYNPATGRVDMDKGLKMGGNSSVVGDMTVTGNTLTNTLEVVDDATLWNVILQNMLHSPSFINGFLGNGLKLWEEGGLWKMELDQLTVRRIFYAFETIIQTVRHINGGLVVSQGSGKIKSVTSDATYYTITVEGNIEFVFDDNIYHQTFTGVNPKYYAAKVVSVNTETNSFTALKSDFAGIIPSEGEEIVQWGNLTNTARQSLIYISSTEDGKPRISIKKNVTSIGTGETKTVMGTLDGIIDELFGELSGDGFMCDNFYGKGVFILKSTGENVETLISATANGLTTMVSALNAYKASSRNHLRNTAFQEAINVANVVGSNVTIGRVTTGNRIAKCNMMSMRQDTAANATLSATGGYVNFIPLNSKSCTPATFSMWVKSLHDCTLLVRVYPTTNAVQSFAVLANVWTKIVVSVPNQLGNIRFGWASAPVDSADIKLISEPILAESTKEQDWQPAPEDNLSIGELASTYSTITQTSTSIAAAIANADGILASINLNASGTVKLIGSRIELSGTSSSSGKTEVDIDGILHAIDGIFSGMVSANRGKFGDFNIQGKNLTAVIQDPDAVRESTKIITEYMPRLGETWYERLSYGDAHYTIANPAINVQLTRTINFHSFRVLDAPSRIYVHGLLQDSWVSVTQPFPTGTLSGGKVSGTLVYNLTNILSFEYTLLLYKDGSTTPVSTTAFPVINGAYYEIAANGDYTAQLIIKVTPLYTPGSGGHTIEIDLSTQLIDMTANYGIVHAGHDHYRTLIARNGMMCNMGNSKFFFSDQDGFSAMHGDGTLQSFAVVKKDAIYLSSKNATQWAQVRLTPTGLRFSTDNWATSTIIAGN